MANSSFTPAQKATWRAQKEAEDQGLVDQFKAGVEKLLASGAWADFLAFQALFWSYSFCNQMLIALQRPSATRCMGRVQWRERTGRAVNKGEKPIRIRAPIFGYGKRKNAQGEEESYRFIRFFKTVSIFDIGQTSGPALKEPASICRNVNGDQARGQAILADLTALAQDLGYRVATEDMTPAMGMGGYVVFSERRIALNSANKPLHQAKTMAHELAHVILHEKETSPLTSTPEDYREVEAESVAYCVMNALGVDTGSYSFGYVAQWSQGDASKVEAVAERVQRATAKILRSLEEKAQKPADIQAEIARLKVENARLRAQTMKKAA